MSDVEFGEKCDHDPCHCKTNAESAVVVGKSVYCCQGCADGEGCSDPSCNCGNR